MTPLMWVDVYEDNFNRMMIKQSKPLELEITVTRYNERSRVSYISYWVLKTRQKKYFKDLLLI